MVAFNLLVARCLSCVMAVYCLLNMMRSAWNYLCWNQQPLSEDMNDLVGAASFVMTIWVIRLMFIRLLKFGQPTKLFDQCNKDSGGWLKLGSVTLGVTVAVICCTQIIVISSLISLKLVRYAPVALYSVGQSELAERFFHATIPTQNDSFVSDLTSAMVRDYPYVKLQECATLMPVVSRVYGAKSRKMAYSLNVLADGYWQSNQIESANQCYLESASISREQNYPDLLCTRSPGFSGARFEPHILGHNSTLARLVIVVEEYCSSVALPFGMLLGVVQLFGAAMIVRNADERWSKQLLNIRNPSDIVDKLDCLSWLALQNGQLEKAAALSKHLLRIAESI